MNLLDPSAGINRLAFLDGGFDQPAYQRGGGLEPGRRCLVDGARRACGINRADHGRLERRLVLLEVQGDLSVTDAPPERQDQEVENQRCQQKADRQTEADD